MFVEANDYMVIDTIRSRMDTPKQPKIENNFVIFWHGTSDWPMLFRLNKGIWLYSRAISNKKSIVPDGDGSRQLKDLVTNNVSFIRW